MTGALPVRLVRLRLLALFLFLGFRPPRTTASAEWDGQPGRLPIMGFTTWCQAGCGDLWQGSPFNVSAAAILRTADRLASSGLQDAGFDYILLDDGWPACSKTHGDQHACETPAIAASSVPLRVVTPAAPGYKEEGRYQRVGA